LCDSKKEIGAAQPRLKLQGLLKSRDCLIMTGLLFANQTKVQKCFRKRWRLPNNGGKTVTCLIEISLTHGFGRLLELLRDTSRERRLRRASKTCKKEGKAKAAREAFHIHAQRISLHPTRASSGIYRAQEKSSCFVSKQEDFLLPVRRRQNW
jgi:hypothetical protein